MAPSGESDPSVFATGKKFHLDSSRPITACSVKSKATLPLGIRQSKSIILHNAETKAARTKEPARLGRGAGEVGEHLWEEEARGLTRRGERGQGEEDEEEAEVGGQRARTCSQSECRRCFS